MSRAENEDGANVLQFSVLGPLEAAFDGEALKLGGAKQQMVLALLLLEANRVVSADRLVEWVWGEDAGERSPGTLQVYVSNLRRLLVPAADCLGRQIITTTRPGYVLRVEDNQLDVLRLDSLRRAGEHALAGGLPGVAVGAFREALDLWRGEPLAGLPVDAGNSATLGRLAVVRVTLMEQVAEAELALGHHRKFLDELQSWAGAHPLNERLLGLLITALYRCGRQADALLAYRVGRRRLIEELGIEPCREVQELEARVLAQDPSLELGSDRRQQSFDGIASTMIRSSVVGPAATLEVNGRRVALHGRITTIGRLPDRELVLDDAGVSRAHAEIRWSGAGYRIIDASSANGTVVNGVRISDHRLEEGDVIRVGATELIFRLP